jgi:hypothetical protein
MEYRDLIKSPATKPTWTRSFANELARLAQGVGNRCPGTKMPSCMIDVKTSCTVVLLLISVHKNRYQNASN